jgi:hypothetical protein
VKALASLSTVAAVWYFQRTQIGTGGVMAEEEKGFVIRDRRQRGAEGESSAQEAPAAEKRPETTSRQESSPRAEHIEHRPPATFLAFVYSLGTSALMMLGENFGQDIPASPQNLVHAQEIIDILTLLETKTKGNLTPEEDTLLQEMLYTLRIKYVEKASSKS